MKELSGSQAGHCKMELWLNAHDYPPEEFTASTLRTFDLGHMIEKLFLETETVMRRGVAQEIGNWWPRLGTIWDRELGGSIHPEFCPPYDRQREVNVDGTNGSIDFLINAGRAHPNPTDAGYDPRVVLIDIKSANTRSFKSNLKGDLTKSPFGREYVMQMQFYMEGLRRDGVDVSEAALVYYNKEASAVMARFILYDSALVEECLERLAAGRREAEPYPDWEWNRGSKIPLRCGYCNQKENCALMRGLTLEKKWDPGKELSWIVQ